MKYLRQNTAATITVGPFLSIADGLTYVTSLAFNSTLNGEIASNGGASAAYTPANSGAWTYDTNGQYRAALATGDIPSVGQFRLSFSNPASFLPVWEDFTVLSGAVYDSLFGTAAISTYAGGAVASVTAGVTVTTNNDKNGYALASPPPTAAAIAAAVMTDVSDTLGADIATTAATVATNLDARVSTRSTYAGGAVASVTAAVNINQSAPLTSTKAWTVGGALNGSWAASWGQIVLNVVARTLSVFDGSGSPSAIEVFSLDSGTNPTARTP